MKHIKFIALILSVLAIFCCSCSRTPKKNVRTIKLHYQQATNTYTIADSSIHIIYQVDTAYRAGDIITDADGKYKIID